MGVVWIVNFLIESNSDIGVKYISQIYSTGISKSTGTSNSNQIE